MLLLMNSVFCATLRLPDLDDLENMSRSWPFMTILSTSFILYVLTPLWSTHFDTDPGSVCVGGGGMPFSMGSVTAGGGQYVRQFGTPEQKTLP